MFCTRCGANNLDTDQFCRSCSTPLTKSGGAPGASSGSPQQPYPYSTPGQVQQQQAPQSYSPYPGYQGHQPPQYGYANQTYPQQQGASGRAITSLILSIISIFMCGFFTSIPGMVLGKMEMNAIRQGQAPSGGEGVAKAGFYIGLVVTILYGLVVLGYIVLIVLGLAAASIR
jgi:Domain of unknown function (DUF4190)/zinc-ribbon domain